VLLRRPLREVLTVCGPQVDEVLLYDTGAVSEKPTLVAHKLPSHPLLVDPPRYTAFLRMRALNESARDIRSL
jgi:hypothetical protein